jgi:hypothetical protein
MRNLSRPLLALAVALASSLLVVDSARAQVHLGPQISIADDADVGLGGRLVAGVEDYSGLEVIGSVDIFFPDGDFDYWEINGNAVYNFEIVGAPSLRPYAGGGLNVAHTDFDDDVAGGSSDTDLGLNLLAGTKFPLEGFTPFVEVRGEISGGEQLVITGGFLFP